MSSVLPLNIKILMFAPLSKASHPRLKRTVTPAGHSAMARTVGVPCDIVTQLVLAGVLSTPGVRAPYTKEICDPIREVLERDDVMSTTNAAAAVIYRKHSRYRSKGPCLQME